MKKYFVVFQKSLKAEITYRSAMIAGIVGTLLSFLIQIFLWKALLGTGVRQDTNFSEMLLYVVINSCMAELTRGNVASLIEASMIDGSVSMELLRPMSFKYYTLASMFGKNIYGALTRTVPIVVVSVFFVSPASLPDFPHAVLFLLSALLGILLMLEVTYLVGLLAFWIQRCWFLWFYLNGFKTFFGGTLIPLWFYPESLKTASYFLPFRYMTFEPVSLFLGKTAVSDAWLPLLTALIWLIGLSLLDKLMWQSATKRLAVNGG